MTQGPHGAIRPLSKRPRRQTQTGAAHLHDESTLIASEDVVPSGHHHSLGSYCAPGIEPTMCHLTLARNACEPTSSLSAPYLCFQKRMKTFWGAERAGPVFMH